MKIDTKELSSALVAIGGFVPGRTPIELWKCVRIVSTEGGVLVQAFSESGCAHVFVEGEGDEEIDVIVNHALAANSVRRVSSESVDISSDGKHLVINSGQSVVSIANNDGAWPGKTINKDNYTGWVEIPTKSLRDCVSRVKFASKQFSSKYAMAEYLEYEDGSLYFQAGNGKTYALCWSECDGSEFSALVDSSPLMAAVACLEATNCDIVSLMKSGNSILVVSDRLTCKIPEVDKGEVMRNRAEALKHIHAGDEWSLSRDDVRSFLSQAKSFTTHDVSAIDMTPMGDHVLAEFNSPDEGNRVVMEIPGGCDGEPVRVSEPLFSPVVESSRDEEFRVWTTKRFIAVGSTNYVGLAAQCVRV